MRVLVVILAWTVAVGVVVLTAGASLFGLLGFALSDPGKRPASWGGWDLLFYGIVVAPPVAACVVTIVLGALRRLPGTRHAPREPQSPHAESTPTDDPWK